MRLCVVEQKDEVERIIQSCCGNMDTLCSVNTGESGSSPVGKFPFATKSKLCCSVQRILVGPTSQI